MYTVNDCAKFSCILQAYDEGEYVLNPVLRKILKRRRGFVCGVIIAFGVSACVPVQNLYAEELTGVEREKSVTEGAIYAEVSATPIPQPIVTPVPQPTEVPNSLIVKRKRCNYPKKLYEGQGFDIEGTLKTNHKIKQVVARIVTEDGSEKCVAKKTGKSKKFNLNQIDGKMKFSDLTPGTYRYKVEVTDDYGNIQTALSKKFMVKKSNWMWPVDNGILGDRYRCKCSYHGGRHYGIDIKGVSKGTKIRAVRDGEVVYAQYHGASGLASFGKLVIIYHGDGIYSYYAHCNTIKCEVGDKVEKGEAIATVGSTGYSTSTHLHLELRKGPAFNGKYNHYKLLDKYKYKQFNPLKKKYLKYPGY